VSSLNAAGLVIGFLLLVAVVLIMLVRRGDLRATERAAQASRDFEAAGLAPDFARLERTFGAPPPPPLRALYADHELLRRSDVLIGIPNPAERTAECYVAFFEPLTGEASGWPATERLVAIANNGAGDVYLVDPTVPDPAVSYLQHEVGTVVPLGVTLSQWLAAPRRDQPDE
jgi:hypothetical protein